MTVREAFSSPSVRSRTNHGMSHPSSPNAAVFTGAVAGLEPYTPALDRRHLAHLLRRATFGAGRPDLDAYAGQTASQVVDALLQEATTTLPDPVKPPWVDIPMPDRKVDPPEEIKEFNMLNRDWLFEYRVDWVNWFQRGGLRERMTLFWHNHFVTGASVYDLAALAYRYVSLLRSHAFGNFKDFVYDIGLTPAMLIYLNGDLNDKDAPNENYARELLELFTMSPEDKDGNPNYTQTDIQEIARALTGWTVNFETYEPEFNDRNYDNGVKTFFGRSGSFGYDDVVEIVFEQRSEQIAYFICENIYREFVYDTPDRSIVEGLASIFLANNFEIQPVIGTLLKSAHFFEDRFIGAKVKSPMELLVGFMKEVSYEPPTETFEYCYSVGADMDQDVLDPPDVSGWAGHRTWLSTNTLPVRWSALEYLIYTARNGQPLDLVGLAEQFPEASDPLAAFKLPVALAEHFLAVPLADMNIGEISDEFDGDLTSFPIPDEVLNGPDYARTLAKIFLGGIPWYEWSLQESGANNVLLSYLQYLTVFPEFQLT